MIWKILGSGLLLLTVTCIDSFSNQLEPGGHTSEVHNSAAGSQIYQHALNHKVDLESSAKSYTSKLIAPYNGNLLEY